MRRHKGMLLLLLLGLFLLSGCWDRRDPDKMAWVTAVGIDKGPQNDYLFSFQIPAVGAGGGSGGSAGPKTGGPDLDVFQVEAPDIVTALDASQSVAARRVILSHAKAVIIGNEIAQEDIGPVIGAAVRFQEFRRNMNIMVSTGTAFDFLSNAIPRLETNSARWFELMILTQAQTGIVPETRIHEFVMATEQEGVGARAALVATRPEIKAGETNVGQTDERTASGAPPTVGSAKAGGVRRVHELPVEVMGAAVFKGRRSVGTLSADETRMAAMLRGEFKQAAMAFIDPVAPDKRIVFRLKPQTNPLVKVRRQNTRVRADFTVSLEADLLVMYTSGDPMRPARYEKLEASVARQLEQRINGLLDKTLNQWGTDMYHIGNRLKPGFATLADWYAFDWGHKVKNTSHSVTVEFHIRRYGLQGEQQPPKE